jgi:hypothetical protein
VCSAPGVPYVPVGPSSDRARVLTGTQTTLYQEFFKKKPDVSKLEEFGTKCWEMVPDQRCSKLDTKAEEHIFTGIAKNAKAWKYYNTISKKVQLSRNFDESDTKLYSIPDEDEEEETVTAEGEQGMLYEQPTSITTPAEQATTPQMSLSPTPVTTPIT